MLHVYYMYITCTSYMYNMYMYVTCILHVYYMYKLHVYHEHVYYMYITCTLHVLSVTILHQYLFLTSDSTGFNFFLKLPATIFFRQCFSTRSLKHQASLIYSTSDQFRPPARFRIVESLRFAFFPVPVSISHCHCALSKGTNKLAILGIEGGVI